MKNYSISWNRKRNTYIAKYRNAEKSWATKWIPNSIKTESEAELWFISWYSEFLKSGNNTKKHEIKPIERTIRFFAERWLKLRYSDKATKINTYNGFVRSVNCWILDSEDFAHVSIQDLDIENQLTVPVVRDWINSLKGESSTKLTHISILSTMLRDLAEQGWISEDYVSPIQKPGIKRMISHLRKQKENESKDKEAVIVFPDADLEALFCADNPKVKDYRRIRYAVGLMTGMRDAEIQGLTFADLNLIEKTIRVERQLIQAGKLPALKFEVLTEKEGWSKDKIQDSKNAIVGNPKYNSKRTIPMHPLLWQILQYWKNKGWKKFVGKTPTEDDPVFPRGSLHEREPGSRGYFCFCDSAELLRRDLTRVQRPNEELTFHSLRRTFASRLAAVGVPEETIGRLLGHAKKGVTQRNYIRTELTLLRSAVEQLPTPAYLQLKSQRIGSNTADVRKADKSDQVSEAHSAEIKLDESV